MGPLRYLPPIEGKAPNRGTPRHYNIQPRRGTPRRYKRCGHALGGMVCARWGWPRAGESSRKPRRPRPYSRASAGMPLRRTSHMGYVSGRATLRNSPTLSALLSFPYHARSPSLYLRRTIAVPGPLHVRISPRNPRMKRRWYGDGAVQVGRIIGLRPYFRHCGGVGAACRRAQIWECGEGQIAMLHAAPLRPWERGGIR